MIEIRKLTIEARVSAPSPSSASRTVGEFSKQQPLKMLPDTVVSHLVQEVLKQLHRQKEDR